MTEADMWAVTDIHIGNGMGISLQVLKQVLPHYSLISSRTYGFYSVLDSSLPRDLSDAERDLIANHSMEGCYLSAAWHLTGPPDDGTS
jgi:hypothetical protein